MQTSRDNEIIKHFEKHQHASIGQIERLFFRDSVSSYTIANRRLHEITKLGYIKPVYDQATNQIVYMLNRKDVKPPSRHKLITLSVYSELVYYGYEVEYFKCDKFWLEGKYRSDAYVCFNFCGRRYRFFIEVQLANHNPNVEKYDELFDTKAVQQELGTEYYPRVLLVSDTQYDVRLQHTKVTQVDTKLNQLSKIIIA